MPLVVGPLLTGVVCVCAEPGNRLAALEGDAEGGAPLLVIELVCICMGGFFIFVAVPAGFEATIAAIFHYRATPCAKMRRTALLAIF